MTDELALRIPDVLEDQNISDKFMGIEICCTSTAKLSPKSTSNILPMSSEEATCTSQNSEPINNDKLLSEMAPTSISSHTIDYSNNIPSINLLDLAETTEYEGINYERNRSTEEIMVYSSMYFDLNPTVFNEDDNDVKDKSGVLGIDHILALMPDKKGNLDLSNEISDIDETITKEIRKLRKDTLVYNEDIHLEKGISVQSVDFKYDNVPPLGSLNLPQDGAIKHYSGITFNLLNAENKDDNNVKDKLGGLGIDHTHALKPNNKGYLYLSNEISDIDETVTKEIRKPNKDTIVYNENIHLEKGISDFQYGNLPLLGSLNLPQDATIKHYSGIHFDLLNAENEDDDNVKDKLGVSGIGHIHALKPNNKDNLDLSTEMRDIDDTVTKEVRKPNKDTIVYNENIYLEKGISVQSLDFQYGNVTSIGSLNLPQDGTIKHYSGIHFDILNAEIEDDDNMKHKLGVLDIDHIHAFKPNNKCNLDLSNEVSDNDETVTKEIRNPTTDTIVHNEDIHLEKRISVQSVDFQYGNVPPLGSFNLSQDGTKKHYCGIHFDLLNAENEDDNNVKDKLGVLGIDHIHALKPNNKCNRDLSNEIIDIDETVTKEIRKLNKDTIVHNEDIHLEKGISVQSVGFQYGIVPPLGIPNLPQDGSRKHYSGINFDLLKAEINDINRFIENLGDTMRDNILQNSLLSNTRTKYDSKETRSKYTELKNPNSLDSSFNIRSTTASGDSEHICNERYGFCSKSCSPLNSTSFMNRDIKPTYTSEMGDMFDKVLAGSFTPNFTHTLNEINELNNSISIISLDIQNAMQENSIRPRSSSLQRDIRTRNLYSNRSQNKCNQSCETCGCCCKSKFNNTSIHLPQFLTSRTHSSYILSNLDLSTKAAGKRKHDKSIYSPTAKTVIPVILKEKDSRAVLNEDADIIRRTNSDLTYPNQNSIINDKSLKTKIVDNDVKSLVSSDALEANKCIAGIETKSSSYVQDYGDNIYEGIPDELLCYKSNLGTYELSDVICNDDKQMIANLEENIIRSSGNTYVLNNENKHPWDDEPDTYLKHITPDLHPTPVQSLQVVFENNNDLLEILQSDDLYESSSESISDDRESLKTITRKTSVSNQSNQQNQRTTIFYRQNHSRQKNKTNEESSNHGKCSRRPLRPKEFAKIPKAQNTGVWKIRDKSTSEKLEYIRYRITCLMEDISQQLKYRLIEPDGVHEKIRRQKRDIEFSSLFARNYLYQLARMLPLLIKSVKVMNKNQSTYQTTCSILLSYHKIIYHGLQAFVRHMPTTLIGGLTNRVKVLLEYYVELNNIAEDCILFNVDPSIYSKIKRLMQYARYSYEDRKTIRTAQASPVTRYTFSPSSLNKNSRNDLGTDQKNKTKNLGYIPEDLKMYAPTLTAQTHLKPMTEIPKKTGSGSKKTQRWKVGGSQSIHMYTKKEPAPKRSEKKADGSITKGTAKDYHSCRTHSMESGHITTNISNTLCTKTDSQLLNSSDSDQSFQQFKAKATSAIIRKIQPDNAQTTPPNQSSKKSSKSFVYDDPEIVTLLQNAEQSVMNIKASHKKAITKFSELYKYNPKKAFEIKRKDFSREYMISRNDDSLMDLINSTFEFRNEIRAYVCSSETTSNLKKKATFENTASMKTSNDIFTKLYENKTKSMKYKAAEVPTATVTKKRDGRGTSKATISETKTRPLDINPKKSTVLETKNETKGAVPKRFKPSKPSTASKNSVKPKTVVNPQKQMKSMPPSSKKSAWSQPLDIKTDISTLNNPKTQ